MPGAKCSCCPCLQVKQLCLGTPYDLVPDGTEMDEFLGRKGYPLARILCEMSSKETVSSPPVARAWRYLT